MATKYSEAAQDSVETAMHKMKRGQLKSGKSGQTVKSRKQAIAIGLSEAREKGAKVPKATLTKKPATKKPATKKPATRKPAARKTTTVKKTTVRKSPAKKTAVRRTIRARSSASKK